MARCIGHIHTVYKLAGFWKAQQVSVYVDRVLGVKGIGEPPLWQGGGPGLDYVSGGVRAQDINMCVSFTHTCVGKRAQV